jgi:hypothetical protein
MRNDAIRDGWQRFLERLRRMWGKPRGGELPKAAVRAAVPDARG